MKLTDLFSLKNLSKREIGAAGEDMAVRLLRKKGYKILDRNYNVPRVGELDIIARDGEYICYVEVRLRTRTDFGTPAETVDANKRRRIVSAARYYAAAKGLTGEYMRFDIVEVYGGTRPRAELIKDAFWAE